MFKYIVTWVIVTYVSRPCPDANKKDEFGRTNTSIGCTAMHGKYIYDTAVASFLNRDSALSFLSKGIQQNKSFVIPGQQGLRDFRIDSVKINSK